MSLALVMCEGATSRTFLMLKEYREKRFGAHEKGELCLYDLLREDLKK